LLASLTPAVLGHVQMLKTSAQVWEAQDRTFASKSKARIVQLRTALVKPKRRDVSMSSYYNNTKRIADTMAAIGSPLADDEIVSYMLAGLGDDNDNFTTSMAVLAGNDDFTLSDLYGHMTAYEARTGDRSSNNSNNQFQHSANNATRGGGRGIFARGGGGLGRGDGGRGNGGGRHNGGYNNGNNGYHGNGGNGAYQGGGHGGGRGDNSWRDGNAPGGGRGRGGGGKSTCQICGTYGHDALRCYQRFNHGIQPETGGSSNRAAHYSAANDQYTSDPNWYLDSGATDHMTNDLERLHTHENYRGNEQIQVANGTHIPILHIGESSLSGLTRSSSFKQCSACP
jgi:histone deacetylase 1/2